MGRSGGIWFPATVDFKTIHLRYICVHLRIKLHPQMTQIAADYAAALVA
jgi:hypothetical protein